MRSIRYLLTAGLLALAACKGRPPGSEEATGQTQSWATTIANRLYERQILSAEGRDELQRRIAAKNMGVEYTVPGSETRRIYQAVDAATVLAFCTQAFQAEMSYRTASAMEASDLYTAGQAPDSVAMRAQRQKWLAALRQAKGDTAAVLRQWASPGQLLEEKIPAEDSVDAGGWTIYPPLGRADLPAHSIADTRSIFGKTRTRTARDFYELGLLTKPDYEALKLELAGKLLLREEQVCGRAAQLALAQAVRPAQRLALQAILTRLRQANVLTAAGQQQALADSRLGQTCSLFDVLPHCAHACVLDLHVLPRAPSRLYTRLLAEVAAIWPAFRYAGVQVTETETSMGDGQIIDQLVTLAFTAGGRRYTTTFTQGYRRTDGQDPDPATGAEVSDEFVAGINQWLRDQGAAPRLYVAHTSDARSVYGRDRVGIIALTSAQREAWGEETYFLTAEDAASRASQFTSAFIEKSLALYQRMGLFAGLTAAEVAAGRSQALSGKTNSFSELLQGFPHLLVATGGEDAEMSHAYAHALAEVAASTRGAFRPTHVEDTFRGQEGAEQHSKLSFVCGTRRYQANLTSRSGWMSSNFLPLVERAVRENTQGGQLCLLLDDESSIYVFLTAAQAATLHKAQPAFFVAAEEANNRQPPPQTLSQDLPF